MNSKKFVIIAEKEHEIEWELGRVQRPSRSELRKVCKVLSAVHISNIVEALESGVPNEELSRFIPFVLNEYSTKRTTKVEKYALWVLACFWYFYGGGPKPAVRKARKMTEARKKVLIEKWVNEDLACPLCNKAWTPNRSFNSKAEALPEFARWLAEHAGECQQKKGGTK